MEYPDIHNFHAICEYLHMSDLLFEEKDIQKIKEICNRMIDLTPAVLKETKEFNSAMNAASRETYQKLQMEYPGDRISYQGANIVPFKKLAIIYEKEGDIAKAISICCMALGFGFDRDGTKGGMEARLEKLRKKAGY